MTWAYSVELIRQYVLLTAAMTVQKRMRTLALLFVGQFALLIVVLVLAPPSVFTALVPSARSGFRGPHHPHFSLILGHVGV